MPDVVVVGAGISGAATAYELARSGLAVVLLDRYGPAAMASGWTLAGVRQSGRDPAELPLARAAVTLWSELDQRLGADVQYRRQGNLRLARTEAEVPVIERLVAEQSAAGLEIVLLRGGEVQEVAPAISRDVLAASLCRTDGHADPNRTVQAFVAAAVRAGAQTRWGEQAIAIETAVGRPLGVRTDRGVIAAGGVVLAAGLFGNVLLEPLGAAVPMEARMVSVMRSVQMDPVLEQVIGVANADCAGRQEADGRFRATGGSQRWHGRMEDGERPAVRPDAGSLEAIVRRFGAAVPAFRGAPIETVWAGLIDLTPDALPVLDRVPGVDGLVVAMGFSGHGFCLGPVTGQIASALVRGEVPGFDLAPFRLERFAGWNRAPAAVSLHG
ncbi:MAG: FAD-binding oxidoreductase [Acetobacteraceae bacterium]|nr:FAD-binding oxidoreductase [Acetobacteraceae bacterium]